MTDVTGLNPNITQNQQLQESGEAAELVSTHNPTVYQQLVQESYGLELSLENGASFTPVLDSPRNTDSQSLGEIYDSFNRSGDTFEIGITEVLALFHEVGSDLRRAVREGRTATREIEQQQLQAQADQIRQAATFSLASGVIGGTLTASAGVATIGGGIAGGRTLTGRNNRVDLPEADPAVQPAPRQDVRPGGTSGPNRDAAVLDGLDSPEILQPRTDGRPGGTSEPIGRASDASSGTVQEAIIANQRFQGASQVITGGGQAIAGGLQAGAQFEEAARTEIEADTRLIQHALQDLDQLQATAGELIQTAQRVLSEVQNTTTQADNRIAQI